MLDNVSVSWQVSRFQVVVLSFPFHVTEYSVIVHNISEGNITYKASEIVISDQ